jgi:serine/threonine protein kinase
MSHSTLTSFQYVGDDELIRSVFLQLIDGLAFLHSLGIAHRDIKPENLVCSDNGTRVRICDFGLATSERKSDEFGCGSTFYIAPECLGDWNPSQTHYDTQRSDIWSLGIILVNLVCGRNPWRIASASDESFTSFLADPTFLRRILPISDECLYVLAQIFTIDPNARISLNKLRRAVLGVKSFFMGEEELRAAHSAAKAPTQVSAAAPVHKQTIQENTDMDFDEEDGDDQWLEHAEYEDDDTVFALDEELACEPDFGSDGTTPSLREDSKSPRYCGSPTTSSTCGSIPGTPIIELDGAMPQAGTNILFNGLTPLPPCQTHSNKKRHPASLFHIAAPRVIC